MRKLTVSPRSRLHKGGCLIRNHQYAMTNCAPVLLIFRLIIYFVVIGFCIIAGIRTLITSRLPGVQKKLQASKLVVRLRQHITLPALLGGRRLEPLPGNAGYLPSRLLSIFIAIYVVLNIVFSAVSFRSFQPNVWFLSSGFELCEYVGNRTGVLSLANMTIAILFSGRNNFLLAITGWSQTTFLTLHRWAARVATLQAVVHSIVYTLAYFEPGYDGASAYAAKVAEPFYVSNRRTTVLDSHGCIPIPFVERANQLITVLGYYSNNRHVSGCRICIPATPDQLL